MSIDWDNLPARPATVSSSCDRRGREMSLYYNTGSCDSPVWVKHTGIIGDMTIGETEDDDEHTTRDPARVTKEYLDGEIDLTISGTQVTDELYAGYQKMFTRGAVHWMALTGEADDVSCSGWEGEMRNKDRTVNGPATGGMTTNFSLKPAACTTCPVRPIVGEEPT